MNCYEHTFIAKHDLSNSQAKEQVSKYEDIIKENSGKVLKTEEWGLRNLSYSIKNSKKGFYTKVGERGVKLSGGQLQRIGIARALYNNPSLLVLDEATSNLDQDTESKILEILLKLKMKKTIIFITHRQSSLSICDRVFKIENNEIKVC